MKYIKMSKKKNKEKKQNLPFGNKRLTKSSSSSNKTSIDASSEFAKALQYHKSGQLNRAEEVYKRILDVNPEHSDSLHLLGVIAHQIGKDDIAVNLINKAIRCNPENPIYYYNLGTVFIEQCKFDEAISSYRKALEIKPDYTEAHNNLGTVFKDQGDLVEAITCFQKTLEINPCFADAHNNMGTSFKDLGRFNEAISYFQKALEIKPDFSEAHNNMGSTFIDMGNPNEAISCFKKALEIKPNYAEAYHNLGVAFKCQGKLVETINSYQKALEINPDISEPYSELFYQFQRTCAWQKLESMKTKLDSFTTEALNNGLKTTETPFINLARYADPSKNYAIAKSWGCNITKAMSSLNIHFTLDGRSSSKTKIAIGYLTNNFQNHPVSHLMLSLFGLHNRDEFEIFCYSYGEDDGSYYRTRIQQDCDKFVDIRDLSHTDAARRIYEDKVDILIDLKGFTERNRLKISALRPAPVQVRYLGLPCTTGAGFFDYIITDRIAMPEDNARYYSENFAYLPNCYQVNDHNQAISNKDWKKSDFGLPEGCFVFCSFNQGYKIEPVMFNTWMEILRQVPESILWLLWENKFTEINLRREAENRGVRAERLVFSDRLTKEQHLGRLRLADLALDTRIVNGIITTSDALWAGVPVITLQGSSFASRISSSILTAIGSPEMITKTLEEYESLAVDIARNPDKLQMIRQKIENNRLVEPLFDTPRFTRNLEKAYKNMWEIFTAGEKPRQIEVVEC